MGFLSGLEGQREERVTESSHCLLAALKLLKRLQSQDTSPSVEDPLFQGIEYTQNKYLRGNHTSI